VNIVQDQAYTNRFVDVHEKVKAFKDRMRQSNQTDANRRENNLVQEAIKFLDKEPNSSR